jgi:hypothetical protein
MSMFPIEGRFGRPQPLHQEQRIWLSLGSRQRPLGSAVEVRRWSSAICSSPVSLVLVISQEIDGEGVRFCSRRELGSHDSVAMVFLGVYRVSSFARSSRLSLALCVRFCFLEGEYDVLSRRSILTGP